ncbi:MAG: hypothetical protein KJP08_06500 [Gammaproteobacteria bacterium]|nr:hypothetical protein [Gammaproteobacteria bacterium]NNF50438.1 hypothetical protein [Woeseiaceae bacterium]MBT8094441.1 hypothetical protein [Gammaproteobacteria bacterium]MBT8105240.1 hypothetical protein [Gammaproteobacteria bacterium]NNK25254.1 hypothetical protein [Woeseiaceae bacterium]
MNRKLACVLGASLVLAACGGDGESLFGEPPPSASFPISSSNGAAAVRVAWESAGGSGALAGVGAGVGLSGSAPGAQTIAAQALSPEDIVIDVVSLLPFGPETFGCAGGTGTAIISGNITNPETLSRDDTFRIEYDMCDDGAGTVTDGIVEMTIAEFTGDVFLGTFQVAADTLVDSLSITAGGETITGSGDARVTIDSTQAPFVSTGIYGNSLLQTTAVSTGSLTNYASDLTYDGNQVPAEFAMGASGTIDSSLLPGSIGYSTEVTFAGIAGSYPNTGTLLVEGDKSTARLVAVDAENVRIDIDSDGDGTVDEMIEMTWDELLNG